MSPTPWDRSTHYGVIDSGTPVSEDEYKHNEPKWLICDGCGARVKLTEDPTAGVDDLQHKRQCPNRMAKSDWYREQLGAID